MSKMHVRHYSTISFTDKGLVNGVLLQHFALVNHIVLLEKLAIYELTRLRSMGFFVPVRAPAVLSI